MTRHYYRQIATSLSYVHFPPIGESAVRTGMRG